MKTAKFFISIFLLIVSSSFTFGQAPPVYQSEVNSILDRAGLHNSIDTNRIMILDALKLSRDNDYADGIIRSYQTMASLELKEHNLSGALRNYLQLLNLLEEVDRPGIKAETLRDLGDVYFIEKMNRNALNAYLKSKTYFGQTNQKEYLKILDRIADTYAGMGIVDSAILVSEEILALHQDSDNQIATVKTLQRIVDVYLGKNNYQAALLSNLELLTIIKLFGDEKDLAAVYNNLGYIYTRQKNYPLAIEHFKKVEKLEIGNAINLAPLYINMGVCYSNDKEFEASIRYLKKAEALYSLEQKSKKASVNQLISSVYLNNSDLYNAQLYNQIALEFARVGEEPEVLSSTYYQSAQIQRKLYDYEKALSFYQLHLNIRDSIRLDERFRQQDLQQQQVLLERAEKEIKLLLVNNDIQELNISRLQLEKDKIELSRSNLELEAKKRKDEILLLRSNEQVKDAELQNQELLAQQTKQALAIAQQELESQKKDQTLLELRSIEERQQVELMQKEAAEAKQKREIESLTMEKEITQLELDNEAAFRQSVYSIGGLLGLLGILVVLSLLNSRRKNQQLEKQNLIIETERSKSEELLLNILPEETAAELKEKGAATPKQYKQATVLFSDFASFTEIAQQMTPSELIEEINACFIVFDEIIERNGLEKIKTIGDAYMAAGGIPEKNTTNAIDSVRAAQEMNDFMIKRLVQKKAEGKKYWGMRIGLHTGPIVAGVVGKNKFAYDIWGDTVNVASRMETNGLVGEINISQSTYDLVKDQVSCRKRGTIDVKHKGEMEMYVVET